jgi:hypothetical protein
VKEEHYSQTGIYLAYPTSPEPKSIFRQKNYKTKVNENHTKVGIAKDSFKGRENGYLINFDKEIKFIPLAIIEDIEELKECERLILKMLDSEFSKVKPSREWFDTNNYQRVTEIVAKVLSLHNIKHKFIG